MDIVSDRNAVAEDNTTEVLRLLCAKGPLCPSQIGVELTISLRKVNSALKSLEARGYVARRPDRDRTLEVQAPEVPWGIALSKRN